MFVIERLITQTNTKCYRIVNRYTRFLCLNKFFFRVLYNYRPYTIITENKFHWNCFSLGPEPEIVVFRNPRQTRDGD